MSTPVMHSIYRQILGEVGPTTTNACHDTLSISANGTTCELNRLVAPMEVIYLHFIGARGVGMPPARGSRCDGQAWTGGAAAR